MINTAQQLQQEFTLDNNQGLPQGVAGFAGYPIYGKKRNKGLLD